MQKMLKAREESSQAQAVDVPSKKPRLADPRVSLEKTGPSPGAIRYQQQQRQIQSEQMKLLADLSTEIGSVRKTMTSVERRLVPDPPLPTVRMEWPPKTGIIDLPDDL